MIYDELKNVGRYRGLYPNLDVLIDWLDGRAPEDLRDLPLGRNEIAGDDVFANVMEAQTRAAAELGISRVTLWRLLKQMEDPASQKSQTGK